MGAELIFSSGEAILRYSFLGTEPCCAFDTAGNARGVLRSWPLRWANRRSQQPSTWSPPIRMRPSSLIPSEQNHVECWSHACARVRQNFRPWRDLETEVKSRSAGKSLPIERVADPWIQARTAGLHVAARTVELESGPAALPRDAGSFCK